MVVDAQPRTILAGTIEEKGSRKEFEHLLGMLFVVLPGLLVADEFVWIIRDGFDARDLCIPPIDRERIAIFGDEIACPAGFRRHARSRDGRGCRRNAR